MNLDHLASMRREYARVGLDESAAGQDPLALFERWFTDAVQAPLSEPNAMALATADVDGLPSVRILLLKGLDHRGAVFFTNHESRKGHEIADQPRVAATMLWHDLNRQVRFEGVARRLPEEESDAYFLSRPEGSRISAVASPQSQVVADRAELEGRWAVAEDAIDQRPDSWGGYRIEIDAWEFWHGRNDRLHDRIRFSADAGEWRRERLAP